MRIVLSLLVFFLLAPAAVAQDLETARNLEQAGKKNEAVVSYDAWLSKNGTDPEYTNVLFHAVSLVTDVPGAIGFLVRSLSYEIPPSVKVSILKYLAQLEELSGRLQDAQKHYEEASYAEPGKKDYSGLLYSARALFSLGDIEGAETRARAILLTCDVQEILQGAAILYARIFYVQPDYAKGIESLEKIRRSGSETPAILYLLGWLYTKDGKPEEARSVFASLKTGFPASPEARLVPENHGNTGIELYPEPSLLFEFIPEPVPSPGASGTDGTSGNGKVGMTEADSPRTEKSRNERISLQTGSFTRRENAVEMVERLMKLGFPSEVSEVAVGGRTYFRVLISVAGTVDDARTAMMKLKGEGLESFLVIE